MQLSSTTGRAIWRWIVLPCVVVALCFNSAAGPASTPLKGIASWYGEAHRGKLMANGQPFEPEKLTAASWFYPLGTRVCVSVASDPRRSVLVTITDRGPAKRLVREGRVIDLAKGAFEQLASPDLGLISVTVQPIEQ